MSVYMTESVKKKARCHWTLLKHNNSKNVKIKMEVYQVNYTQANYTQECY